MILAIDPGTRVSTLVGYGDGKVLSVQRDMENITVVHALMCASCWTVVFEQVTYSKGPHVLLTQRWSGRMEQACYTSGTPCHFLPRLDVKMHLANGRAKDPQIRAALIDRFGGTYKKPGPALKGIAGHAWSALAVAVTWADQHKEG